MTNKKFYPKESARFAAAIENLKGHKVAVLGHQRPDGDCIGSTVAFVRVLKSLGIEAIGLNRRHASDPRSFCWRDYDGPSCRLYAQWSCGRIC
jgi:hypothetical protein